MTNKPVKTLSCALSAPAMRQRKDTVIRSLVAQIQSRKELLNGFSYKFSGGDPIVDELAEFVKTERTCCSFFSFHLFFQPQKRSARLTITGPTGTKAFIQAELGM